MFDIIKNNAFYKFAEGFTIQSNAPAVKEPRPNAENNISTTEIPSSQATPVLTNPIRNDVFVVQNNTPSQNDKNVYGKRVLYGMLTAAAIVLMFTKGFSGNTAKKLRSFADWIENSLLKKASKNNKVADALDSGINYTSKSAKRLFSLSNAIANFTSVKDTLFRKIYTFDFLKFNNPEKMRFSKFAKGWNGFWNLKLFKLPENFFNFLTKKVLKITEGAIDSSFHKVYNTMDNLTSKAYSLIEKSSLSAAEKAKAIKKLKEIDSIYNEGFSKTARNERLKKLYQNLSKLKENVSDSIMYPFEGLFDGKLPIKDRVARLKDRFGNVYGSYITATQAKGAKIQHQKAIMKAKIALTNDISDVTKALKNVANDLKHSFDVKDKTNRLKFGEILTKIEEYGKLSGSTEGEARKRITNEIISSLDAMVKNLPNYTKSLKNGDKIGYSAQEIKNISSLANALKETLTVNSKKGIWQEFLSDIKGKISDKEYRLLKLRVEQLNDVTNKAVEKEGNNMCDKIAESIVGSIPTDMLGIGFMGFVGAKAISSGKDKNEKVGATLKVGLPLLGTIATYFYSASKAFSGTANILLSLVSGFVLNRMGSTVNDYYQKRYVENKPVNEIVKDAVNNVTKA